MCGMHLSGLAVTLILLQGWTGALGANQGSKDGQPKGLSRHPKTQDMTAFYYQTVTNQVDQSAKIQKQACKDFYSLVCTNFTSEKENTRLQIDKIMKHSDNNRALASVRNFYHACINKNTVTDDDMNTLKKIISKMEGWHILNSTVAVDLTYPLSLIWNLEAIGFKTFWDIHYKSSKLDGVHHEIWMYPRDTIFQYDSQGNRLDYISIEPFRNQMVVRISMLGVDNATAQAVVNDVLYVDGLVAKALVNSHGVNSTYVRRFQYVCSWMIDWAAYFADISPSHVQVDSNSTKLFFSPSFMTSLYSILNTESEIKRHANYLFVRFIDDLFSSIHAHPGSPHKCWHFVESRLPLATDALYVRKYFTTKMQERATKLAESIRNHTMNEIQRYPIPHDDELKLRMISKVKNASIAVGYPPELFDDRKIEEFYTNLVMNEDDFMGDLLNYTNYRYDQFDGSRLQSIHQSWIKYPRPLEKLQPFKESLPIGVPANVLHTNYYRDGQPMYLNYAGMGRDIADKLIQTTIWKVDEDMHRHMQRLIECQIRFLVGHDFKEIDMDLKRLPHEPQYYYDRLSLTSSYAAYEEWLTNNLNIDVDRHDDLSPKQMFWVSAMRSHCHPQRQTRPIASFINFASFIDSPKFRRDYDCPYIFGNTKCQLEKQVSMSKSNSSDGQ